MKSNGNSNMRRICPACGSKNVAKIMYGYPIFDDKLSQQLNNKEVKLGGCIIDDYSPKYFCNDCKTNFDTSPSLYIEEIIKIRIRIGGFMHIDTDLEVTKSIDGSIIESVDSNKFLIIDTNIIKWNNFVSDILKCKVLDWKDNYNNPFVLDGIQWDLTLYLNNGKTIEKGGSNDYPPHWNKFRRTLNQYYI